MPPRIQDELDAEMRSDIKELLLRTERIETTIGLMTKTCNAHDCQLKDHSTAIGKLKENQAKATGAAAVIGAVVGTALTVLGGLILRFLK